MRQQFYLEDSYCQEFTSEVLEIGDEGIKFAQTIFYPRGGGQPEDQGSVFIQGEEFEVSTRILDYDHKRIHLFSSMWRSRDWLLSATCESLSIFVDHHSRKSTSYPDDTYQKIKMVHHCTENEPVPAQVNQPIGIRRN